MNKPPRGSRVGVIRGGLLGRDLGLRSTFTSFFLVLRNSQKRWCNVSLKRKSVCQRCTFTINGPAEGREPALELSAGAFVLGWNPASNSEADASEYFVWKWPQGDVITAAR